MTHPVSIPEGLPPQFLNWRLKDGVKIPCTPDGRACDAHNTDFHLTYEQAAASPHYNVAFALRADDPWFFLDLDKCHDGTDWSKEAQEIVNYFPGAWIEVSQSGRGLHIMGKCDPMQLVDRRNKWDGWLECYTKDRFIAFGPHGWSPIGGTATDKDWTRELQAIVPEREFLGDLPDGRDPSYTGPEDDDQLIAMMLRSGGAAVAFGEAASVKDLWEGNVEVLAKFYPAYDDKQDFDHSSADAALMTHLAFWTGKDMPRMDRLFRKSALMRDKYEKRADYRRITIQNAARLCKRVFTREANRVAETLDERSSVDAIAKAFVSHQTHAGRWIHVHAAGKDYLYNGGHWSICSNEELLSAIRGFVAFGVKGQKASQHKPAFWEEVRKAVRIDPSVARAPDALDADLSLLNTPKGTLNLSTGLMQAHDPADMLTHMTAVAPEPYQGTRWDRFLQELVGGDIELAAFLQVAIGAALSGAVDDHWFALLFGQGRNGKSLFIETIMDALGSYAIQIPSQALMSAKNPVGRDVLAQLQGKRLVITSEVDSAAHFDEVLIKSLTGDKRISARPLYRDTFSFPRSFKLVMVGNHRPQLRTDDTAMRSRLKLVGLNQDFSGDRGDPSLGKTLRSELGCVLQWMIEGSQKYRELGKLPHSRHVEEQVEDYFSSQATVEQWIEECIVRVPHDGHPASSWQKAGELYSNYTVWCRCTGTNPANQTRWSDAMQRNGFRKLRSNGWRYVGAKIHSGGHHFPALPAPS